MESSTTFVREEDIAGDGGEGVFLSCRSKELVLPVKTNVRENGEMDEKELRKATLTSFFSLAGLIKQVLREGEGPLIPKGAHAQGPHHYLT